MERRKGNEFILGHSEFEMSLKQLVKNKAIEFTRLKSRGEVQQGSYESLQT